MCRNFINSLLKVSNGIQFHRKKRGCIYDTESMTLGDLDVRRLLRKKHRPDFLAESSGRVHLHQSRSIQPPDIFSIPIDSPIAFPMEQVLLISATLPWASGITLISSSESGWSLRARQVVSGQSNTAFT